MTVTFLGHCGFAVDTGSHLFVFDYCPGGSSPGRRASCGP